MDELPRDKLRGQAEIDELQFEAGRLEEGGPLFS